MDSHNPLPQRSATPLEGGDAVQTSSTGAVLGQPGKEHGAYGMVRDRSPAAATPSSVERSVRGVGPDTGRPAEDYLLDSRGAHVPSLPTDPPAEAHEEIHLRPTKEADHG